MTGKITKAKTRGQRKRDRQRITLAGGDEATARPTGRDRRHTNQPQEDARAVALTARKRITGKGDKDALDAICGTDMGLCIDFLLTGDARANLIGAWEAISAARRNYRARIIGKTGEPQGAAIAMIPERVETDQGYRVDIRTSDERDRAAKAAWASWQSRIDALPTPLHKWALHGALDGFMGTGVLWRDARPTSKGEIAVASLRIVAQA